MTAPQNLEPNELTIPARDGYPLAARVFSRSSTGRRVVVINSATAVPQRFYRHFAAGLAEAGYTAITYDYRGIEISNPKELKHLSATARDWAVLDLPGVLDWVADEIGSEKTFLIGHSLDTIGHLGFFKPRSQALWNEVIAWLDER